MRTDSSIIERELSEQAQEVQALLKEEVRRRHVARHLDFSRPLQIVQGVRGSGKTFTLLHVLKDRAIPFAYADFSGRLSRLRAEDFPALVESIVMVYGMPECVVLDECLNLPGWRAVADMLVEMGCSVVAVYSGMEETDGDDNDIPVTNFYPLSFSEFCIWHSVETEDSTVVGRVALRKAFESFLEKGGFPRFQQLKRTARSRDILEKAILERDARGSFQKEKRADMAALYYRLLKDSPVRLRYNQLSEGLGMKCSDITMKKIVGALKRTGALYGLDRFATFDKQRTLFDKVYAVDPVFLGGDSRERALETVVYAQLRRFCERHGYTLNYYGNRDVECNFAVCKQKRMRTIVQVMDGYSDHASVKEKVAGLVEMSRLTGCDRLFILTGSVHDHLESKGLTITVIPVYEFLTDRSHKIVSD